MEANYGSGKWCRKDKAGNESCLSLQEIEKIINDPKVRPEERAAAWAGWHETSRPIRKDYQRFVELTNEGAKEMGFADAGEVWRGGYDMSAADFEAEVERLWGQVKPLYDQLHCYVRGKLNTQVRRRRGAEERADSRRTCWATCGRSSGATSIRWSSPTRASASLDVTVGAQETAR